MKKTIRPHRTTLLLVLTALLLFPLVLTSCGKKNKPDPNKSISEIHTDVITGIKVSEAINVKFKQTEEGTPQITITCKKAIAPRLNVHMEGTTLVATYKSGENIVESGVEIIVSAPAITEIEASSAATVNLGDELDINGDLSIVCRSAGSVKCKKLHCQNLIIEAAEASLVQITNANCNNLTTKATTAALVLLEGKTINSSFTTGSGAEIRWSKLESKNPEVVKLKDPEVKKYIVPGSAKKDTTRRKAPQPTAKPGAANGPAKPAAPKPVAPKPTAPAASPAAPAAPTPPASTQPAQ